MHEIDKAEETKALTTQEKIDELEKEMLKYPQVHWEINHHFGPGVYVREMRIPAGAFILGHKHKHPHLCALLQGALRIARNDGTSFDIAAPFMYTADPGRKAMLCLADAVFVNIHPNIENETDIDAIEDRWVEKSEAWKEANQNKMLPEKK